MASRVELTIEKGGMCQMKIIANWHWDDFDAGDDNKISPYSCCIEKFL